MYNDLSMAISTLREVDVLDFGLLLVLYHLNYIFQD